MPSQGNSPSSDRNARKRGHKRMSRSRSRSRSPVERRHIHPHSSHHYRTTSDVDRKGKDQVREEHRRKRRRDPEVDSYGHWGDDASDDERTTSRRIKQERRDDISLKKEPREYDRGKRELRHNAFEQRPIKHERDAQDHDRHNDRRRRDGEIMREQNRERQQQNRHRRENRRQRDQESGSEEWGRPETMKKDEAPKDKEKPNFELSGKLTEDTNTFRGVVIKYNEPPEARKPKRRWRLYPFKGDEQLPILHIHRQSAYLLGRDRKVADIPTDHPSCSKQHAALQFRLVDYERSDGKMGRRVRPYVIDLASANGTFVNNKPIETQRYVELFEKDVLKFGFSSREYVLMHDKMDTSELDDDQGEPI